MRGLNVAPPPERLDKREELEDGFKDALDDVVRVIEALRPYCQTPDELSDMVKLALQNKGQLKLLMATITAPSKR
jgi:hypothetical protein